ARGEQTLTDIASGIDVQPPLVLDEVEREVVGRIHRRAHVDGGPVPGPCVLEVDLLPERAVDADLSEPARRAELDEVAELTPRDRAATGAGFVVDQSELQEAIPAALHEDRRRHTVRDERAGSVRLSIDVDVRPDAREEASRPDRPPHVAIP